MGPKYEATVYQDTLGEWRWRLTSLANGQVVGGCQEGYVSAHHARDMLAQIFTPGSVVIADESQMKGGG